VTDFCAYSNASLKQQLANCCIELLSASVRAKERQNFKHFKNPGSNGCSLAA